MRRNLERKRKNNDSRLLDENLGRPLGLGVGSDSGAAERTTGRFQNRTNAAQGRPPQNKRPWEDSSHPAYADGDADGLLQPDYVCVLQ